MLLVLWTIHIFLNKNFQGCITVYLSMFNLFFISASLRRNFYRISCLPFYVKHFFVLFFRLIFCFVLFSCVPQRRMLSYHLHTPMSTTNCTFFRVFSKLQKALFFKGCEYSIVFFNQNCSNCVIIQTIKTFPFFRLHESWQICCTDIL